MRESEGSELAIAGLVLTSAFYLAFTISPQDPSATALTLGGIGPEDYTTIQSAIDACVGWKQNRCQS